MAGPTRYDPAEAEPRVLARWLESGLYSPQPPGPDEDVETFAIAVPPPNVTGALHMGHALNGTIQDTLCRLHRLRGERVKWILGTDHAGIATQAQVEKAVVEEGTSREALGREAFVERTWRWREEKGGTIIGQFQRLGASLDYADERFTLDERYAEAVLRVFVELYDQGLIYRDHRLVNWDPGLGSAVSDLEVEEREVTDTLYEIAYPLVAEGTAGGAGGLSELVVATVRPETMLADVAVAVHPDDERFAHLVGRTVRLPLTDRELPVIADTYVKTDFGTGCLKITPGHDPNDFEIGRRHDLPTLSAIGEDGRMTQEAGRFAGVPVLEARAQVVAALRDAGLLRGEEPLEHAVPYSHRSGERIEPLISLQWFMRMDELARPAIEAVEDGRVRIHPESQRRRYLEWLGEIRPWCVSRQLWWGHRIPVWYRGDETVCALKRPEGDGWEQDPDVLDTWFSSGLWPFATLGWPDETPALRAFYPTSVLSTARDILFLWVARMVMLGLRFTGDVPFSDVYIHSVIQAPDGRRMSKSLGTGIDPLDLIAGGPRPAVFREGGEFPAYGADAVRFGLLAMSSTQDVRFSEEKVAQGAQLANKLFNATRFVLLNVGEGVAPAARPTAPEDRWILTRLDVVAHETAERLDAFDFAKAALGLYDFIFGELCDWYLELIKGREFDDDLSATVLVVLRDTLRLAHPVIPFVTEQLWAGLPGADGALLLGDRWPEPHERDDAAVRDVEAVIAAVTAVRAFRDRAGIAPGVRLAARARGDDLRGVEARVASLARLDLEAEGEGEPTRVAALDVWTPAEAREAADAARVKQRAHLESEIARAEGKLANERFVAKAPEAVVQAERDKLAALRAQLAEA